MLEILAVFGHIDIDLLRHEDSRADELHECASDITDILHRAEIYGHVDRREEALPALVAVGPPADDAVSEGSFARSRIVFRPRKVRVVCDLAALCLMVQSGLGKLALTVFIFKVEHIISLILKNFESMKSPSAEVLEIFVFRLAPAGFGYRERPRPVHVFGMRIIGYVLRP